MTSSTFDPILPQAMAAADAAVVIAGVAADQVAVAVAVAALTES